MGRTWSSEATEVDPERKTEPCARYSCKCGDLVSKTKIVTYVQVLWNVRMTQ
jgi:hypothetical protein